MMRSLLFGGASAALHLGALMLLLPEGHSMEPPVAEVALPVEFVASEDIEAPVTVASAQAADVADASEVAPDLAPETAPEVAPLVAQVTPADVADVPEPAAMETPNASDLLEAAGIEEASEAIEASADPALASDAPSETVVAEDIDPALAALPLAPVPPARPDNLRTERPRPVAQPKPQRQTPPKTQPTPQRSQPSRAQRAAEAQRAQDRAAQAERERVRAEQARAESRARAEAKARADAEARAAAQARAQAQAQAAARAQQAANAYRGQVQARIARVRSRRVSGSGRAVVTFSISGSGGLAALGISQSSGNQAVDQAALDRVRRAAPFPPPPPGAATRFSLPLDVR